MCKLAQRAQREATGYYCGYTFKRQPVGRHELKASAQSLNYVRAGLADKQPAKQYHRISKSMVVDLQHRSMLRTAPEEFNLAANVEDEDVLAAEFIRTFTPSTFEGSLLVKRYDAEVASQDVCCRLRSLLARKQEIRDTRIL